MRRSWSSMVPVAAVVVCAVATFSWASRDDAAPAAGAVDPVELVTGATPFATFAELVAATDVVVDGVVVAVDEGRSITDPLRPEVGIVTRLVQVDGTAPDGAAVSVTVEQEASLLDGTPVVVDGVPAIEVGDRAVAFLVRGTTEDFPYTALVNAQAWVPVVDGSVSPLDPTDPIAAEWAGRTATALLAAVDAARSEP